MFTYLTIHILIIPTKNNYILFNLSSITIQISSLKIYNNIIINGTKGPIANTKSSAIMLEQVVS